jgi:predicted transposase YdaD
MQQCCETNSQQPTLPLTPMASVSTAELPRVIRRMEERFEHDCDAREIGDYWVATYLLMGLVFPENIARALLKGVRSMKESTTYRAILREGEAKGRLEGSLKERLRKPSGSCCARVASELGR